MGFNCKYKKIIFVCTSNTCRGPMAEVLFRSLSYEMEIEAVSRGLVVLFPEPSNPKAELVLKNHELILENHISTRFTADEIDEGTLILAMTENQKKKLFEEYGCETDMFTIKEFAGEEGDVLDPYGGDLMDYESCYIELSRLIKKTVVRLHETTLEQE